MTVEKWRLRNDVWEISTRIHFRRGVGEGTHAFDGWHLYLELCNRPHWARKRARDLCVKKTRQTRRISFKRDVYQWKETHKRDLYFSKETYITYMRPAKVTYIKQRAKTWKKDLRTETIYSSSVYFTQKETYISQKRPIKRPTSLKRGQYHFKETYASQHSQKRPTRET